MLCHYDDDNNATKGEIVTFDVEKYPNMWLREFMLKLHKTLVTLMVKVWLYTWQQSTMEEREVMVDEPSRP